MEKNGVHICGKITSSGKITTEVITYHPALERAAQHWRDKGLSVELQVSDYPQINFRMGEVTEFKPNVFAFAYAPNGETEAKGIVSDIVYNPVYKIFLEVLIHEFGHALGLGHHKDSGCIMHSRVTVAQQKPRQVVCDETLDILDKLYEVKNRWYNKFKLFLKRVF